MKPPSNLEVIVCVKPFKLTLSEPYCVVEMHEGIMVQITHAYDDRYLIWHGDSVEGKEGGSLFTDQIEDYFVPRNQYIRRKRLEYILK